MTDIVWHDLECGGYDLDLPIWRGLAEREGGPVLDLGCGTGRVTLDLARRGREVVALDVSELFLGALRVRAEGLPVRTERADARAFALGTTFPLILAPMQTVQLLGGSEGRMRMLRCAREHLAEGGLLAAAIADSLEAFDADHQEPPLPDMRELAGVVYASRPIAVRDLGDRAAIDRVREIVARDGTRTVTGDVVELDRLSAAELEADAACGLRAEPRRFIPSDDDYIGSTVVMLRG